MSVMKNLSRLRKLGESTPYAMKVVWAFDQTAFADAALTSQQRQLIAVAVGLTTQRPYCIELHTQTAP
jgi:alkylhydroperoxidase/carboxymuconolactone decarboxylase family protein YurZ